MKVSELCYLGVDNLQRDHNVDQFLLDSIYGKTTKVEDSACFIEQAHNTPVRGCRGFFFFPYFFFLLSNLGQFRR